MNTRPALTLLASSLAMLACGGGGDDAPAIDAAAIDAVAVDAAIDARQIDAAPVCSLPRITCAGECVDPTVDERYCGDCDTACSGGTVCNASACACADITVDPNPSFVFENLSDSNLPGATVGIGAYFASTIDVLVIGRVTADTAVNTPHALTGGSVGTPPFAAFGYDVDPSSMTASAAYYATAGTLTFTKICLSTPSGQMAGFSGTLSNAVLEAVDSLQNPVLVPGGCRIPLAAPATLPTITFSYGNVSCQ